MKEPLSALEAKQYSPLALAFLGDSVYEIMMREHILLSANMPASELHSLKVKRVCASYQAAAADIIMPVLTEEEISVYKRGRNATGNSVPKNGNAADYHKATGLESLFGYLHLKGENHRLNQLFDIICQADETILRKEC
ncbi:MAG: Mini-ribonuclease 3 [Ruminococcus sp.]